MANPFTSATAPASSSALDYLMPDVALDQRKLARQQAMIDALRQQALEENDSGTQVVSGWAIPNGINKPLNKLAAALGSGLAQRSVDEQQADFAKKLAARFANPQAADGTNADGSAGARNWGIPAAVMQQATMYEAMGLGSLAKALLGQYEPTSEQKNARVAGQSPDEFGAALRAKQAKEGTQAVSPGETLIAPDGTRTVIPMSQFQEKTLAHQDVGDRIAKQRADAATSQANTAAQLAGTATQFGGSSVEAQAMNAFNALSLKEQRGEPLTPEESMMKQMAVRTLTQPKVVGTADGGFSVVNPPALPTGAAPSSSPLAPPAAPQPAANAAPLAAATLPGGPSISPLTSPNKPPSQQERLDAGFAARMEDASKRLTDIGAAGYPTVATDAVGRAPLVGNALERITMTPAQQTYRQAQEDWVRAKLRKESGAAIGKDEMEKEITTYFPQPGDSQQVIAEKEKARGIANAAMGYAAGSQATEPLFRQLQITPSGGAAAGNGGKIKSWKDL